MNEPIRFDDVEVVIRDELHFKYKLDIGEDAFKSLRVKKYLLDAVDAGNGALVGFGAAKSSVVATTFFAPGGFLGAIGIGTAATPIGWAIAAGIVGAGLSLVIGKRLIRGNSSKVRQIPDFINSPMDLLAIGLFDLIGLLSIKVALVDGAIDESERHRLRTYFVDEWGYDEGFVDAGLKELERSAENHTLREVAEQLAQFKRQNPDCNYTTMAKEVVQFLRELSEVDGIVDERELVAIKKIEWVFEDAVKNALKQAVADTLNSAAELSAKTKGRVASTLVSAANVVKRKGSDDKE